MLVTIAAVVAILEVTNAISAIVLAPATRPLAIPTPAVTGAVATTATATTAIVSVAIAIFANIFHLAKVPVESSKLIGLFKQ